MSFSFLSLRVTSSVSGKKTGGGGSLWQLLECLPSGDLACPSRQLPALLCDRGDGVMTCFAETCFWCCCDTQNGENSILSGGHLHTAHCYRQPALHLSEHPIGLQQQCRALQFSIDNLAEISGVIDIWFVLSLLFVFCFTFQFDCKVSEEKAIERGKQSSLTNQKGNSHSPRCEQQLDFGSVLKHSYLKTKCSDALWHS